ncbi:MAG: hypothetical protein A3B38_02390 [Candidatus Levybacteria bacterium RIFCSPLOWO2_01_FULL_36_13]|nr:MAG: hypothetical protein A2684_03585 [Candidatus Levybacteria bacterium RIFCSPHIGHO2_01_FULL_36_15b]OGH35136.1 MAG: hypothetical protein A3B38_02390 [Candidatus Levybacteria bacterium RIFCSPLOWO2_01_FULL_36_13]
MTIENDLRRESQAASKTFKRANQVRILVHQEAVKAWEDLENTRIKALEGILKEKDLGVCSEKHYPFVGESASRNDNTELGIFPTSQLKYYFVEFVSQDPWFYMSINNFRRAQVRQLCQGHSQDVSYTYTELIEEKGKFLLPETHRDVTELKVNNYPEAVFAHLGIASLPARPRF